MLFKVILQRLSWRSSVGTGTVRRHATLYKRSALLTQFNQLKEQHQNHILLFQVGDFYEIYGQDAELVAAKTNLQMTRRLNTSMAGFPVRSLSEWQRTLVQAGFQLAVCNQQIGGDKSNSRLLRREVVKLVTAGTLLDPVYHHANYLMAIAPGPTLSSAIAWLDLSTAHFQVLSTTNDNIDEHLERVCPAEVLLPSSSRNADNLSALLRELNITNVPDDWYTIAPSDSIVSSVVEGMYSSNFSALEQSAASVILHYVLHTQRDLTSLHISTPSHFTQEAHLMIDANTRRALELTNPLHSNPKSATLIGCVDRTVTAMGSRLLHARLASPLTDVSAIQSRLEAVAVFVHRSVLRESVLALLRRCSDLERMVQKVSISAATSTDLLAVKNTLVAAGEIRQYFNDTLDNQYELSNDIQGLHEFPGLVSELESGLSTIGGGDYIREGYSSEVDRLRNCLQENQTKAMELCSTIMRDCKPLTKLTVVNHKSFGGRVLETTKTQSRHVTSYPQLVRVDQTQDRERYSHPDLQLLNTQYNVLYNEYCLAQDSLFNVLCDKVKDEAFKIMETAHSLAKIDVTTSLAKLAAETGWCKPSIVSDPVFAVQGSIHPVVFCQQKTSFVRNDCYMDNGSLLWVITGPNMGGKSTFLRQNCLLVILAQMGSYVPAQHATIGIVDKLFARVGSNDNVVKHMSTFQMEMLETANILSFASSRSFVILDEIGRGTSTLEGLAIAQATMEHIHNSIGCRTLLATHFHELALMIESGHLTNAVAYKLLAHKDDNGSLFFTYRIAPGYAESSLGIDVAELAGLPKPVIDRAKELFMNHQSDRCSLT